MTVPIAIIAVALVVAGVLLAWKAKQKGIGAGLLAAAGALFALLVLDKEKRRAGEVSAKTENIKEGREEATADSEATEAALTEKVKEEVSVHAGAAEEQEALATPSERQRIDS